MTRIKTSGVYAIRNLASGRCYIGSSVNVSMRWYEHLSYLRRGIHHCESLQSDWVQFGPESFGWQILEVVESRSDLIAAEQRWLDKTRMAYNTAERAGSGPREGFKHSEESKRLMSEAAHAMWSRRARVMSPEHREALRRSNIGRGKTTEERRKISEALKGRAITWGAKISTAKKGKPLSDNARIAYDHSRSMRGRAVSKGKSGVPWSPARRAAWLAKKMA